MANLIGFVYSSQFLYLFFFCSLFNPKKIRLLRFVSFEYFCSLFRYKLSYFCEQCATMYENIWNIFYTLELMKKNMKWTKEEEKKIKKT